MIHPYRVPGHVRLIAYSAILILSASAATLAAVWVGPWWTAAGSLAGYWAGYVLHEFWAWHWWRRWHGVPDFSGSWLCGDEQILIRQTWTRMSVSNPNSDQRRVSRMAMVCEPSGDLHLVFAADDRVTVAKLSGDILNITPPSDDWPAGPWTRAGV